MFSNYLKIALRTLQRNKLYSLINLFSFVLGLTIFVFGGLIVKYELTHDMFFPNSDRIYTVGTQMRGDVTAGTTGRNNTVYTAVGPLIDAELTEVEQVARALIRSRVVAIGDEKFNQQIRFADPSFLKIFQFDYIAGDASALDQPTGLLLTESTARRHFGTADVIGETVTLDNKLDLLVTAVIKDVPANSHFNSTLLWDAEFEFMAPVAAYSQVSNFNITGGFRGFNSMDLTYVLLPEHLDLAWLEEGLGGIYQRHMSAREDKYALGLYAAPLADANLAFLDNIGLPVTTIIQLLSLLVIVIICVNYTNLATAQSLGRSREVGLRKTMGATRTQLLLQFQTESLLLVSSGMLLALACLEFLIPAYNTLTGKGLLLDYGEELPGLVLTTMLIGLAAGGYPAWIITRSSPIAALRDEGRQGQKGSWLRSGMIGLQFAISAFMLALAAIIYAQNLVVEEGSYIFPRDETYALRLNLIKLEDKASRLEILRRELERIPAVAGTALAFTVPFDTKWGTYQMSRGKEKDDAAPELMYISLSPEFLELYEIPFVAGRNFSRALGGDRFVKGETEIAHVIINERAVSALGFASPGEAVNQRIYAQEDSEEGIEYLVVGVVPTLPHMGQLNQLIPQIYIWDEQRFNDLSVRMQPGSDMPDSVRAIEETWKRVIPEYPISGLFLSDLFMQIFRVFLAITASLAGFALVALTLAMIGLFGVTAFMAAQRTKEISVRKVLGASTWQIVQLMLWKFLRPVLVALLIALPCAFAASSLYLRLFSDDRITTQVPILASAGALAVSLAVITVISHVLRVARASPIVGLRYE